MARVLTYLLLIAVWIASGAVQVSAVASALAMPAHMAGGPVQPTDAHAMHMSADKSDTTALQGTGGCDRSESPVGADENGSCCPSMCQTVGTIEPDIAIRQAVVPRGYGASSPVNFAPVPVPASERPPRLS